MLRRLLLPVLLVLFTLPLQAQNFRAGLKAGSAITTIRGETQGGNRFERRSSFGGGAFAAYDFRYGLSLQAELLYMAMGADGVQAIPNNDGEEVLADVTFNVVYVHVPLLLVYRPRVDWRWQPKVFLGPTYGMRQDATVSYSAQGGSLPPQTEQDNSARGTNWLALGGLGLDIPVGEQWITLEVSGIRSLTNMRNASPSFYNQGLFISVGLMF